MKENIEKSFSEIKNLIEIELLMILVNLFNLL